MTPLRCIAALAPVLLSAAPAAALSVSVSACNGESAELVDDGRDVRLEVNGTSVPLEQGFTYDGPICVTRDGVTLFGFIRIATGDEEDYLLLDPRDLRFSRIPYEEAEALDFWQTEDDWFDD